jgi:nicotinamide-nucleotide amidase
VKLAYLPSLGQVRLRLTGRHEDAAFLENYLTERAADFQKRVQEHVFGTEKETLETVVGDILRQKGHTLGLAESCTGGYLAHLFTANAGSSDFFTGSIVAYSNIVKQNVLGVSSETLDSFGAVSEECVREMAAGARRVLGVDYAISVSGIAGPGGGTPEKPVGTIWFAIASKEKTVAFPLKFGRDRLKNIQLTTVFVLNTFRKFLIAE